MTTMKHKSADAKRKRRNRYKDACKPIMQRFGCTAMQVAELVVKTVRDNDSLMADKTRLENELTDAGEKIAELEEQILQLKNNPAAGTVGEPQ